MSISHSNNSLQLEITNRQILGIALPISLAMLIPQLNFITNNIFIGRIGETELATAGITGVFYLIFALVGNGLNSGLQGLLSRRAGENRPLEIGKLFSQGLWIALFFAIAAVLITWFFSPYFLSFSIHDPEVRKSAVSFLQIRVWGVFFLYGFQICNAFLVSTNNSRYMKYGFWIQAGLNIFLDWLLIFGHYGFPELGFNGAAWASVISEFAGMLVVLGIVLYKKFHVRFELFKHWRYHAPLAGLIFRQSSPLVAQWLISIIAWLLFYIFIEHLGVRPLAISNIMRTIFGLFGIFVWAFASTTNTMVSNIIGQDKKEQVVRLIKKIMMLSLGFTFILCVVINVFPALFIGFFTNDRSFIDEAIPVIRMVTIGIMAMSPATVWLNSVTGTGNTKVNLAIEIVAIILYTIYIYLIIELWKLSLVWAFSSEMLYWLILFILSYFYIRSGHWKKKNI